MKIIAFFTSTILLLATVSLHAGGLDDLQRFHGSVSSYSATFEQQVMDENMNLLEASSGEFSIQRPGKFRWHYRKPSEQLIVGDGSQVWIYDIELEQITHRSSTAAVTETPAMLLSGEGRLEDTFILEDAGQQGGLDWVRMLPRNSDSGFTSVQIGFAAGKLQELTMQDNFGQTTTMRFTNVMEGIDIPAETFNFSPPQGVDVIEEAG